MKRLIRKAKDENILFVVDVQRDYMPFIPERLFESIHSYVTGGNWDEVVVIVDNNNGDPEIPDWLSSAATDIIQKSYGGMDEQEIIDAIDAGEMTEEDGAYRDDYGNLIVPNAGQHGNFYVPEDLEHKAKNITKATVIGGAEDECLEDVDAVLAHLGVETTLNRSLCYGAGDKHNDDWYEYEVNWVMA